MEANCNLTGVYRQQEALDVTDVYQMKQSIIKMNLNVFQSVEGTVTTDHKHGGHRQIRLNLVWMFNNKCHAPA